jgi:hypothetical protein
MARRALAIYRQTVGERHPYTGRSASNVAHILGAPSKFAEAEPFAREAVDTFRQVFGERLTEAEEPLAAARLPLPAFTCRHLSVQIECQVARGDGRVRVLFP